MSADASPHRTGPPSIATDRPPRSIHVAHIGHKAPIPLAARVGNFLASSAIAGKDPADGSLPSDGARQVANAFTNLRAVLQAGGAGLPDVLRLSVTLADDALRDAVNEHWLACFPDPADRPARHISTSALQHGMQVQLEVLAVVQARGAPTSALGSSPGSYAWP